MAPITRYLADTSAISRFPRTEVANTLGPLVTAGVVATCGAIDLQLLAATRTANDYPTIAATRRASFTWLPTEDADLIRALHTQSALASRGQHRLPWPQLLIAAVAERHQVTLLHYHPDYDLIADITGQPTQWVVPKGSLS
jgi:predicted nucleic acid-binding protein